MRPFAKVKARLLYIFLTFINYMCKSLDFGLLYLTFFFNDYQGSDPGDLLVRSHRVSIIPRLNFLF